MVEKPGGGESPTPPTGTPIVGTPPLLTGVPPVLLEGTSQGRKRDLPPENWIPEELQRYGVLGTKNILGSNLNGTPHPIFDRERWPGMDDRRFEALHQSIRLASILLEIGMPYLASFLPESNFRPNLTLEDKLWALLEVIDIRKKVTESEVDIAKHELNEIARNLEWREDPHMLKAKGWWGITASSYPRTTANFGMANIMATKATDRQLKRDGFTRRTCTVGICSQYVDTLLRSERASEQHLCAAFHLAVTLVHELAHVVFWQKVSNEAAFFMGHEPSIDGQPYLELGFAFTGWIFGGWNPQPIMDDKSEANLFRQGMFWDKQLSSTKRPNWKIKYSMPFEFIQRLMTQSTWDAWMDNLCHPYARSIVLPVIPFRYGQYARTAQCERVKGTGGWDWKIKVIMSARFDVEDGYEELGGPAIPGIPSFGFMDQDWTAGPEAEDYGNYPLSKPKKEDPLRALLAAQNSVTIVVTYAGIYSQSTKTVLVGPSDCGNEQSGDEPPSNLAKYQGWSEGVLRGQCAILDLSSMGGKDELAARLAQYDGPHGINKAGPTGDGEVPGNTEPAKPLSFNIAWDTKVSAFKKELFERTGIPIDLQLLQLQNNTVVESDADDITLKVLDSDYGPCSEIRLYRLQSEEKPDPGPLIPLLPTGQKLKHTTLTPFHIAIIDNGSISPRILASYHPANSEENIKDSAPIPRKSIPAYLFTIGVISPPPSSPSPYPPTGGLPPLSIAKLPSLFSTPVNINTIALTLPSTRWADKLTIYRLLATQLEHECHELRNQRHKEITSMSSWWEEMVGEAPLFSEDKAEKRERERKEFEIEEEYRQYCLMMGTVVQALKKWGAGGRARDKEMDREERKWREKREREARAEKIKDMERKRREWEEKDGVWKQKEREVREMQRQRVEWERRERERAEKEKGKGKEKEKEMEEEKEEDEREKTPDIISFDDFGYDSIEDYGSEG